MQRLALPAVGSAWLVLPHPTTVTLLHTSHPHLVPGLLCRELPPEERGFTLLPVCVPGWWCSDAASPTQKQMQGHLLIFVFHLLEYRGVSRLICVVLWTENSAAMGCKLGSVGERLLSGYRPWVPPPVPQSQTSTHSQKSLQRRLRVLSAEFSSLSIGYLCKLPVRWPLVHQESPQPAGTGLPHPPSLLTHHCGLLMSAFKYQKFLTSLLVVTLGVTICTSVLDPP